MLMISPIWLALLVMLPLLAAVVAVLVPNRWLWWVNGLNIAGLWLAWLQVSREVWETGVLRFHLGDWVAPLGIDWVVDGLAVLMLLLMGTVGSFVSLYAFHYFADSTNADSTDINSVDSVNTDSAHKLNMFVPLWLILWAGLNGLVLSADIFNLYVTLEILSLAAVGLILLSDSASAREAGLRYLLFALFASMLYLLGVAFLYGRYGALDIASLAAVRQADVETLVAVGLLTVGILLKSALFPLHFWLPPAHSGAPTPVSALLSALVVKATFYLLLRLWFELFPTEFLWMMGQVLGVLGALAIVWGSLLALRQVRLKLLVAYSTVAQLGYFFLLFPLASEIGSQASILAWYGGIYQAFSHGFAKAAMFLAAGNALWAFGHDRVQDLQGFAKYFPITLLTFALAGVSIMGLPPSGGFIGKWLILSAAIESGQWWWAVIILLGGLLAAGYVFNVLHVGFTNDKEGASLPPLPLSVEWLPLGLAIIALMLGVVTLPVIDTLAIGSPVGVLEFKP